MVKYEKVLKDMSEINDTILDSIKGIDEDTLEKQGVVKKISDSPRCFSVSSSTIFKTGIMSPSYYDIGQQKKEILNALGADLESNIKKLRKIISTKKLPDGHPCHPVIVDAIAEIFVSNGIPTETKK